MLIVEEGERLDVGEELSESEPETDFERVAEGLGEGVALLVNDGELVIVPDSVIVREFDCEGLSE